MMADLELRTLERELHRLSDKSPAEMFADLDALSRRRALTALESLQLERAIRAIDAKKP